MDTLAVWELFSKSAGWRRPAADYEVWRRALDIGIGAILPRVGDDLGMDLYLLGDSPVRLRTLREIARQVFGEVWLNIESRSDPLQSPQDTFEEALRDAAVGAAVRVRIAPEHARAVASALDRLSGRIAKRPTISDVGVRDAGLVLRQFQAAIGRRDISHAEVLLAEMKECGLFEAHNLAFLRLWGVARADPEALADAGVVPVGFQHSSPPIELLRAIAESVISIVGAGEDGLEWAGKFWSNQSEIARSLCGLTSGVGASMRVIAAALGESQDTTVSDVSSVRSRDALPAAILGPAESNIQTPQRGDGISVDVEPCGNVAELVAVEPSIDVVRQLLQMATQDSAAYVAVSDMCSRVGEESLAEWRRAIPLLEALGVGQLSGAEEASQEEAASYLEWLVGVEQTGEEGEAKGGWQELPLFDPDASSRDWGKLVELLSASKESVSTAVKARLPQIINAWSEERHDGGAAMLVSPMLELAWEHYLESAEALAARGALKDLYSLMEVASDIGFERSGYTDTLGFLASAIEGAPTVGIVPGAVEILELLLDAPCPDAAALEEVLNATVKAAHCFLTRLDEESRWVLQELLRERGRDEAADALAPPKGSVAEDIASLDGSPLGGMRIGIYSLEVGSLNRARTVFEAQYGAEVIVNSDKTATELLRGMCKGCDAVVMVHRAAQHAATNEIRRIVPKKRLVRVWGKGASSIIRDTLQWGRAQVVSV